MDEERECLHQRWAAEAMREIIREAEQPLDLLEALDAIRNAWLAPPAPPAAKFAAAIDALGNCADGEAERKFLLAQLLTKVVASIAATAAHAYLREQLLAQRFIAWPGGSSR